jgi:RNA 2',3'-cyclic 3'-phosphodiesterase
VAVRPPPETLDLIERLPRPARRGTRWTRRDQWHVTLLFLAEADVDEMGRRLRLLQAPQVTARVDATPTSLGRSAVVLRVGGLEALAAAVHEAVGVVAERPFEGHLTIARVDRRSGRHPNAGPLCLSDSPARTFEVTEIELVRSEPRAHGARHTVELTVALLGPSG